MDLWLGGGFRNLLIIFTRNPGEDEPNVTTSIFFIHGLVWSHQPLVRFLDTSSRLLRFTYAEVAMQRRHPWLNKLVREIPMRINMMMVFSTWAKKKHSIYIGVPNSVHLIYKPGMKLLGMTIANERSWSTTQFCQRKVKRMWMLTGLRVRGVLWLVGSFRSSFPPVFWFPSWETRKIPYLEMWSPLPKIFFFRLRWRKPARRPVSFFWFEFARWNLSLGWPFYFLGSKITDCVESIW